MEFFILALTLLSIFLIANLSIPEDDNNIYTQRRWEMIETQIVSRGIRDSKLIRAMLKIPRHKFVPENLRDIAYGDNPLPIGMEQTISQPYDRTLKTK